MAAKEGLRIYISLARVVVTPHSEKAVDREAIAKDAMTLQEITRRRR